MACVLCCGTIRQSKCFSFIPCRTFCQRRRYSSADHAFGMEAGVIARLVAACMFLCDEAAPVCGDSPKAGTLEPAIETAKPDDAPHNKSLRVRLPENGKLDRFFIIVALHKCCTHCTP